MEVDDLYRLLTSTSYYAGIGIDSTPELLELLIMLASRIKGKEDTLYKNAKGALKWVPLQDVNFLYATFAKITNNYQAKGVISAVTSKTTNPSPIERVVRA